MANEYLANTLVQLWGGGLFCEHLKFYDPLLSLLPSVRNEEIFTEGSKGNEGDFVLEC